MKRLRSALLLAALLAASAARAQAQLPGGIRIPLTLEVTPTLGVSTGSFASTAPGPGAGAGTGLGGGAVLDLTGTVGVFGQYQRLRFACDGCTQGGLHNVLDEMGWEAGLQLRLPLSLLGVTPWARAGVLQHQLQFSGQGGKLVSDAGTGLSVGAGADLPVFGPLALAPAVRYRAYPARFEFSTLPAGSEGASRTTDVKYLTVDLGIALRF